MNLDILTKEQITTLIRCLHEAIIQTNENLSKMIISDEEDDRHFKEINKYLYEVRELHSMLIVYKTEKWGWK